MKILSVKKLALPEIKVIGFARFKDNRGYFAEPFRKSDITARSELSGAGIGDFVQQNESFSLAHTLRGLHFQWNPYMGKFVRTLSGHMIDIVLDIRKGSPTFGKVLLYDMPSDASSEVGEWIWVPPGFAHGNIFLEPTTIEYLCTGEYSPGCEACISPLSQDLDWSGVETHLRASFSSISASPDVHISDKDRAGMSLADWSNDIRSSHFVYGRI